MTELGKVVILLWIAYFIGGGSITAGPDGGADMHSGIHHLFVREETC